MARLMPVLVILALLFGLFPAGARADEITDQIDRGLERYRQGQIAAAIDELSFALGQLKQLQADRLVAMLPPAPAGWTAEPDTDSAGLPSFLGGGITAGSRYQETGGPGEMHLSVVAGSPLIAGLAPLLTAGIVPQGAGSRLMLINGQKALLTAKSEDQAELQMIVDGTIIVQISASGSAKAAELVQSLAKSLDIAKLRAVMH